MAMTPDDVLKMIKDKEVKFVDIRFTDTRGKEQHVSVPAKQFTKDKFTDGHAFDGSSIAGWKGIQASDMLLMPDAVTARMDPFTDEAVLNINCDVVEPTDGKPYNRCPRGIAKRAEAYLKSSGLGDVAYFGPEPEFFIFDGVTWSIDMSGCLVKIKSEEAPWSTGIDYESGNMAHRAPVKGGYFPGAAGRYAAGHPQRDVPRARAAGRRSRSASPRSGGRRPVRDRHQVRAAGAARRLDADPEVHGVERRRFLRQDGDLHAQAHRRRQRLGHARAPVGVEGRQQPVRGQRLRRPVGFRAVLHRRHHQARQGAERDHQSGHQLLQAPGPGLRGADQPRVLGEEPLGVLPHSVRVEPEGAPRRSALPGSDGERLSRVLRDADGGPGRRAEQDPSRRSDRQGPVPPAAGRGGEGAAGLLVARRGARRISRRTTPS